MPETTITESMFNEEIKNFKGVALVDFWAEWCGPCRIQGPIIEELADDFSGNESVKIRKLNIDDAKKTAQEYNIMSIPTIIMFKDGKPMETMIGVQQKDLLKDKINSLLN